MGKRALRRARTAAVAKRRQAQWARYTFSSAPKPAGHFAKSCPLSCSCRKRNPNAPRVHVGMCTAGERDRVYQQRAQVVQLNNLIVSRHVDPWDDEVTTLF